MLLFLLQLIFKLLDLFSNLFMTLIPCILQASLCISVISLRSLKVAQRSDPNVSHKSEEEGGLFIFPRCWNPLQN